MCGICGSVAPVGQGPAQEVRDAMRAAIRHRGPDGDGDLLLGPGPSRGLQCWLGHCRLKIIDLTPAADQPMVSRDGFVALTYNGEVYNFRQLRRELEDAGPFHSTGDTEVVLRAYERWGDGFVSRLDGMFALAIWDSRSERLLLARDRTGKKPLFYSLLGGRLTFASEIKALLRAPWIEARPHLARLAELLSLGYVAGPETMYEGIVQVPPGSTVVYGPGGLEGPTQYWDALPERQDLQPTPGLERRVAMLVEEAVKRRLVSDVPLGALLSGGIDSSIVVGLMSRHATEPIRTFSIGFPEEPSYDERGYARKVAAHFETRHTEFAVEVDAVALMDRLLWHHDQPYADSSAIPTFLVCQLAREHVTVALNGDGGDEVFGGYDRFRAAALSSLVPGLAATTGRRLVSLVPRSDSYYGMRRRLERFLGLAGMPVHAQYEAWVAVADSDLLDELLRPAGAPPQVGGAFAAMRECYARAASFAPLDQLLYANFKTYLPDDLAVKMDRMSMASSLETRSPFLDTQLIEYLARVPARHKVGLRRVKPILRRAFWNMLPPEIWNRPKHGFGVPVGRWFRGELGRMFEDEVLAPTAGTADLLDRGTLERALRRHREGQAEHGHALWTILTLERWLRTLGRPSFQEAAPAVAVSG